MQKAIKKILLVACLIGINALPAGSEEQVSPDEITLVAVGDIMLGGRTIPFLKKFGPEYPFVNVKSVFERADIIVGNLESPISDRGTAVENKKFTLRAEPDAVEALEAAGFRVVTLANNHAMDFGPLALQDTLDLLDEYEILYTGAGRDLADAREPAFVKIKDKTLVFLAYSLTFPLDFFASPGRPGTAPGYREFVEADIKKVRPLADIVVVSFHWGAELMTTAKDYQIELGRQAIDWGADLVLGHHPHVLQELEWYKNRLIAYSLGNFVFGSESNRTNTSILLLVTFKKGALARVETVPLDVNNYRVKYQPEILRGKEARAVLENMNMVSERFETKLAIVNDRGIMKLESEQKQEASLFQTGLYNELENLLENTPATDYCSSP
ncbi:MAG: CapA family protein [Nitrospirota bacterium]